jgi:hypothetical protein
MERLRGEEIPLEGGERVHVRPVPDRFEILQRAIEARDRAAGSLRLDEQRLAGRRALIEANVKQDREAAVEQTLAVRARKILPDGSIAERFAWQADRQLPDPPAPQGPDAQAGESEDQFDRRKAEHDAQCERLASERSALADGLREEERQRLAQLPESEMVELLLAEEVRAAGAEAFAQEYEVWTVYRAAMKPGGEEPYFAGADEVRALPARIRGRIFEKHEELCAAEEGDVAAPFPSRAT